MFAFSKIDAISFQLVFEIVAQNCLSQIVMDILQPLSFVCKFIYEVYAHNLSGLLYYRAKEIREPQCFVPIDINNF